MKTINSHIITGSQTNLISKIERFQGAFEATRLQKPALLDKLKKDSIITSTGSSIRIEDAIIDDEQVQELVENECRINNASSRSQREAVGYVKALNYIHNNYKKLVISEKTIKELHLLLTSELTHEQLPSNQRGVYKDIVNDVVETDFKTGQIISVWFETTAPGAATQMAMENLISDYNTLRSNQLCHDLIIIAGFIAHFLAIHPFRDANGRLSRLLTTLLLLQHDYKWVQYISHEQTIEDNKEYYYVALRVSQTTFTSNVPYYEKWIDFFLNILSTKAQFLKNKILNQSPLTTMNDNETKVYQILEGAGECKIGYLLKNTQLTRPGLKTLLKRLINKGIFKKKGQGKGTSYYIKTFLIN